MATASGPLQSNTSETADAQVFRTAAATRPYLILVGGAVEGGHPPAGRLHAVDAGLEIGRKRPRSGRGVRILALGDPCVSSEHARITRTAAGFELRDLDSRNGTFVNGVAVDRQQLRDGALLFFGAYVAVFRFLSSEDESAIEADLRDPFGPVATASAAMARAIGRLRRLAPTMESLLLTGETGTGKEVYARAIHQASGRRGRFVGLNCAALPVELVESELFGYVRGAHSQATQAKRGLVEQAEGGTLFLDEIGDMPQAVQAKLLRFLQEREVLPLGGTEPRPGNVRVIAATAEIDGEQDRPRLRRDLLRRLAAQPIELPPLRHRPEDLGALISHALGPDQTSFDNPAFLALCLHDWPGNVRELEKVVREAAILRESAGPIRREHLPAALADRIRERADKPKRRRRSPKSAPGKAELLGLLQQREGRVADVARLLDRRWSVVLRWIKRHQLDPERFRRPQ
jgi:transcriptional regulator with PAS, ATPase and Fis domain